jgi:hypothetical protein
MANMLIGVLNFIITAFGTMISSIFGLLPVSPFSTAISFSGVSGYLSGLAWFVPINIIITMSETWLAAILVYYGYMIVLRWVKVVS